MSDEHRGEETEGTKGEKPLTVPEVIWAAARWLAKRELLMRLAIMFVLVGMGGGGVVVGASELEKHDAKITLPLVKADEAISARVSKLETSEAARLEREAARDRVTMETNLNVRLFLESQKIKPIDVPRFAADAGQ